MRLITFITTAFLLTGANVVYAEDRCPFWTRKGSEKLERAYQFYVEREMRFVGLGYNLDQLVLDVIGGEEFRFPIGFKNPWPIDGLEDGVSTSEIYVNEHDVGSSKYGTLKLLSEANSPHFAFWMPDLRPVERNMRNSPHLRPCEAGRPEPISEQYVVRFKVIWPFVAGAEHVQATQKFRDAEILLRETGMLRQQSIARWEHSLSDPISGLVDYNIYHDDGQIVVMLFCTEKFGERVAPNPICAGHVWEKTKDLVLAIRFPSDRGQRGFKQLWRDPVSAAIQLAEAWHKN